MKTIALQHNDCELKLKKNFLSRTEADELLKFASSLEWEPLTLKIFGKSFTPKRKTLSYGDEDHDYVYSGTVAKAKAWPSQLVELAKRVSDYHPDKRVPNFVLCNYYENGEAYISPHSDDEKDLIKSAVIFSISVGAERDFVIQEKEKGTKKREKITIPLTHGSLCIMGGRMQEKYVHSVPKRKKCKMPRINFTFRYMK